MTNNAMLRGESSADFCRRMGWTVGERLVGNEGYGDTVIEITAIGESLLIAKTISHNGDQKMDGESLWSLACRDWAQVKDEP